MAAKLNIRFIGITFVIVSIALAIVAVLWVFQYKADATRNVRAGDEMMAAGDYRLAKDLYGRAVFKDQTNREYLKKYEAAILAYQPTSRDEAREWYAQYVSALAIDAQYRSSDPTTHQRFIGELITRGSLEDADFIWREVEDAAERMWDVVPEENPDRILAKLYRSRAVARRVPVITPEEISRGEQDLKDFLEVRPDSDEAWSTLTLLQLAATDRFRAEERGSEFDQKLKELRATRERGVEAAPDGFAMALANARALAFLRGIDPESVTNDDLRAAIDRAVDLAEGSDDRMLLQQYVQLMRELDADDALRAAVELLRRKVEDDPQAIFEHLRVASGYLILSELDETEHFSRKVLESPRLNTSFVSQAQFDLRREAARMLVDVAVRRWDGASVADRPAMLERVDQARSELAGYATGDNDMYMLWADARIALLHADYETAAAKFEQYIKARPSVDLESLLLSAKALEEIKQFGLACDRVAQVAAVLPTNVPILAQLARLQYNIGRRSEALATLARAEQIVPDHPAVVAIRKAIEERAPGAEITLSQNAEANELLNKAREAIDADDMDSARTLLRQAAELAPDDLITLKMWFNVEVSAGNLAEARELAAKARELAPNDRDLLRVTTLLSHEDPVEAVKEFVAMMHSDEGERVVTTMVNLRALAAQHEAKAASSESVGDNDAAAAARAIAERATREADAMLDSAERLAPDNRTLIEHQFVRATLARNWEKAQQVVERAANANVDLAHGALYKGRLALARGNFEQAVREILPATEELSYSAYAWRLLGMAYEGVGNISDARRSYQRSYECNPNDLATLRIYCELLVRIGDPQRAITILRNAVNLLSDTSPAVEFWLGLEAEYGDMGVVLKRRRDMYERSSENSINGLKLASLLGQVKPRRDLIFSADGNPQYAGTRWDRMSSDEQRRILDDERAKWLDESESILKALESHGVRGLAIVSVRARNAMARQQVAEGEQLLRAFIEEQRAAGTLKVNMVLALGQYLAEARRYEEARDVFLSARELQDAQRQEADLMLGEFFFRGNRFEQAAEAYQRVADNGGAPVTRQRLVECYIKTRQYEQAAVELERLLAVAPADYISVMLEAALAEGRGETLHAAGRIEEANAEFAKQQAALDRATAMAPSQPMPHVQRAIAYLAEYRRTQDAAVLDEAMSALDTAAAMRSDFPAVSIARADVLLARGNLDMAIGELGRLLQKAPESIPVRRRLIELLLNSGRVNEAGNVLLDATTLFPDSPMWFEYYGDLKVAQGDVNAAEPMYAKAFQLDSTPSLLAKLATARLRLLPPNARGAADLLTAHINTVEQDPTLRGIYAEALNESGRELMALEQTRASYQQFRDAIEREVIGPEMISQWYVQLRKLYDPPRFADMERFVREVANDKLTVYDVQWLARIWSDGDSDSLKRAIELQNEALEMVPKEQLELRLGLLNDLSLFYTRAGDYSRAIEVMEQLITEQPNNAMALNNLAYLMGERSHDLKRAISHAERANELKPNDPNILDTLGVLLMLDSQYPRAEEFLRRSTELAPVAGTYLHMAQLLSRMGQPRYKVENAIRRAEELNPDPKTRAEIDALLDDMRKTSP